MNLIEFISSTYKEGEHHQPRPRIVCKDGFSMSVQASAFHYCTPRETQGSYLAMEIGYPSEREDLIIQYAGDKRKPKNTVYGWVPSGIIERVIEKHGGIDEAATFAKSATA